MLNYKSNTNLLKGLLSDNRTASYLYDNRDIKRKLLRFLKESTEETGLMPNERYKSIKDALRDAMGGDLPIELLNYLTSNLKG